MLTLILEMVRLFSILVFVVLCLFNAFCLLGGEEQMLVFFVILPLGLKKDKTLT